MALPVDAHVLGLDRDAPLALEVHRVEVLLAHVAGVDGAGDLEDAVRQRRLAVVDVGDDREVADAGEVHGRRSMLPAGGWRLLPVALVASGPRRSLAELSERRSQNRRTTVANIKSQKKRNITNAKRAERNKAVKSELKTRVKTAVGSIGTDDERRGRAPRRQAHRHGRRQGRHPPEPGRPPQEPPDEEGQRAAEPEPGRSVRRRSRQRPQRGCSRATRTSITTSSVEVLRAAQVEVGAGEQVDRPLHAVAAEPAVLRRAPLRREARLDAEHVGGLAPPSSASDAVEAGQARRSGRAGSPSPAAGGARRRRVMRCSSAERRRPCRRASMASVRSHGGTPPASPRNGSTSAGVELARPRRTSPPACRATPSSRPTSSPRRSAIERRGRRRCSRTPAAAACSTIQPWRSRARVGGVVSTRPCRRPP